MWKPLCQKEKPFKRDILSHTDAKLMQHSSVEWMAFIVMLCCIVPFVCCLSPGTSWSTHSGCITQQSNPDCEGLLAQPKGQGRLYGWHTLRCVNSTFVPYAYAMTDLAQTQLCLINPFQPIKKYFCSLWPSFPVPVVLLLCSVVTGIYAFTTEQLFLSPNKPVKCD